jgi:hypothetical protein
MKLIYWIAVRLDDRRCYSIRERTRDACAKARRESGVPRSYATPKKVVVEYEDAFDLVRKLLGDGGVEPWD